VAGPRGSANLAREVDHGAIALGTSPGVVVSFCRERARRRTFVVLCPTRYPTAGGSQVTNSGQSLLGPSFYWASFNDTSGVADNGHLILGGQRPPFSLVGTPGQLWPRPGQPHPVQQLNVPRWRFTPNQGGGRYVAQRPATVLRDATVGGQPALVLVAPPYPDGGLMGGHVIVVWNSGGHGYLLSLHFEAAPGRTYTLAERTAAALAVANSFKPVTP
jgi:hypothetical protein